MATGQKQQRVFTGTVTKLHDNFGFIDDDVFFQLAACDGKLPMVGDKVIVEAHFNPGMPFKWNASRVQFLGHQNRAPVAQMQAASRFGHMQSGPQNRAQFPQGLKFVSGPGGAGLLGPAPVNVMQQRANQQRHQMKGNRGNGPRPAAHDRRQSPQKNRDRKRRSSPPRKQPSPSRSQRSISTDKSDKSQRRPAPRYMVDFVKRPLTLKKSDVLSLKGVHSNMYIPSDFFTVKYNWQETFPLQQPHTARKCMFHVLQKDVQTLEKLEDGILSPPDADHAWVAKVMLMQAPSKDETYKQCCRLAEESSEHFLHQSRVYKFLVGCKGKKELMAIGGSWSPSLDGADPGTNPRTLVNTAIRTCKALTGIDLRKCTNWRRMLEIQYHRGEEVRKGQTIPNRVETTVIFLPDVHSCLPTPNEYNDLRTSYLDKCEAVIAAEQEKDNPSDAPSSEPTLEEISEPQASTTEAADDSTNNKEEEKPKEEEVPVTPKKEGKEAADEKGKTPTHHSQLDVSSLKVQLLRKELEARGLSSRGLKAALIERLNEAVEAEAKADADKVEDAEMKEAEEEKDDAADKEVDLDKEEFITKDEAVGDDDEAGDEKMETSENGKAKEETEEEKKKSEEKPTKSENDKEEKVKKIDPEKLKLHYTLPDSHPVIPVHPNSEFKKGNFECSITPLSNLLGYRQEDNKESIFEVSLFAEAFTEMLQQNHAFNIYTALTNPLPEVKVEKEEEEKKEEEEEKEKEEKKETEEEDEPKAKKSKSGSKEDEEKAKKSEEKKDEKKQSGGGSENKDEKKHDTDSKNKKHSSHRKSSSKPEEKMVTLRKDLLLSFVYFDHTQCGYIKSGDMADIIHSVGLGLSRSQITKLLSKFLEHDHLKYRKLTDVPVSQLETYKELLDKFPKPRWEDLISGNKHLIKHISNGDDGSTKMAQSDGVVNFNGAVIDIKALQEKLTSSEDHQADMESTINKLKSELDKTSKELCKTVTEKKTLEEDFEATKKELSETKDNFTSASEMKQKFEKTLKSIAKSVDTALPKEE